MKTFSTPIFVPTKSKKEMSLIEMMTVEKRLNTPVNLPSDLYHGSLDDIGMEEEFEIVVNGQFEKHRIKMRACNNAGGKIRFMFVNPELPEVFRFAEWRIKSSFLMSTHKGTQLQLRNFSAPDLRRMIRHSVSNCERDMVTYR